MSGRVQLASIGTQDAYLTGQPEITYFLKRFKRHTKFATETIDNALDGDMKFGSRLRCTIPRKGDLIKNIYLRIELSDLTYAESPYNVGYTDSIGHAIIEYADLTIGGQTIERLTGEYLEIYSELFFSESQQRGVEWLTGKTGTRAGLGPASTDSTITNNYYGKYPRTFFILLPFYFNRHESMSIPLSAIDKQEVEIEIKLRHLSELYVQSEGSPAPPSTPTGSIVNISMPVEYVFITDDEMNYIKNQPINYVITQLQLSKFTIEANETSKKLLLRFVNPVKELYMVIQNQEDRENNDWFKFKNDENTNFPLNEQLDKLSLSFNNEERITDEIANALFLRQLQPMNFHTRIPDRFFYTYSFSLDPENHIPSGQVNMSRIQNKVLKINTTNNTKKRDVRIYAKSYNVLRIQYGLAGVLFTDNNFIN
jgi:hypothetical protein